MECKLRWVHPAISYYSRWRFSYNRENLKFKINDVHKFNDPKLRRNPTTCQLGKYIACYYDKIWHIGVILECSIENQDVKVKFMTRKGLNLQWVNDAQSSQCWVPLTNVICEISPPLAKGQSASDCVLTREDYNKSLLHAK